MVYEIPMFEGQSDGFGTKAGDQQYVNGMLSVSASRGPSENATGSRSIESLHPLITSPRLARHVRSKQQC